MAKTNCTGEFIRHYWIFKDLLPAAVESSITQYFLYSSLQRSVIPKMISEGSLFMRPLLTPFRAVGVSPKTNCTGEFIRHYWIFKDLLPAAVESSITQYFLPFLFLLAARCHTEDDFRRQLVHATIADSI
jgi:hypothetical protein